MTMAPLVNFLDNLLYQVCVFRPGSALTKIGHSVSDLPTHFPFLCECLTDFEENLTGSKYTTFYTKFIFLGQSVNKDGHTSLWLADFSSATAVHGFWQNLTEGKYSTSSTFYVFHEQLLYCSLSDTNSKQKPALFLEFDVAKGLVFHRKCVFSPGATVNREFFASGNFGENAAWNVC